jgi:hypothetical protein
LPAFLIEGSGDAAAEVAEGLRSLLPDVPKYGFRERGRRNFELGMQNFITRLIDGNCFGMATAGSITDHETPIKLLGEGIELQGLVVDSDGLLAVCPAAKKVAHFLEKPPYPVPQFFPHKDHPVLFRF